MGSLRVRSSRQKKTTKSLSDRTLVCGVLKIWGKTQGYAWIIAFTVSVVQRAGRRRDKMISVRLRSSFLFEFYAVLCCSFLLIAIPHGRLVATYPSRCAWRCACERNTCSSIATGVHVHINLTWARQGFLSYPLCSKFCSKIALRNLYVVCRLCLTTPRRLNTCMRLCPPKIRDILYDVWISALLLENNFLVCSLCGELCSKRRGRNWMLCPLCSTTPIIWKYVCVFALQNDRRSTGCLGLCSFVEESFSP